MAGLASGALGAATGLTGPPIVILFTARQLARDAFRGTISAYFIVTDLIGLAIIFAGGTAGAPEGKLTLLLTLPAALGVLAGNAVARRLSPAAFRALLARIVENDIVDRVRWSQRGCRDWKKQRPLPSDTVLQLDAPARSVTEPPDRADRNEQQAWLRLALELLEPDDREVIRLRDWDGLSFIQLGERLDTTEEAARKRYVRALPKLSQKLELLRRGQWQNSVAEDQPTGGGSNAS